MDAYGSGGQPVQNERRALSRPQVYVQLQWGLSWSQQHSPQKHSMTYMSRGLQNSRDMGHFPRQIPPSSTNYLAGSETRPRKPKDRSSRSQAQHQHRERSRDQDRSARQTQPHPYYVLPQPYHVLPQYEYQDYGDGMDTGRRQSRSEIRQGAQDRGCSAPPPLNGSPWDAPVRSSAHQPPATMKDLPAPPSLFRLGTDDLPWDTHAWPHAVPEGEDDEAIGPLTAVPASTSRANERRRGDDPDRVGDLASLSTAMMTVDNGFEEQWWYQGVRQPTDRWAPMPEETQMSMSDPVLVSALEPTLSARADRWGSSSGSKESSAMRVIVSPISQSSSPGPLHRSLTTRSEELFIGM